MLHLDLHCPCPAPRSQPVPDHVLPPLTAPRPPCLPLYTITKGCVWWIYSFLASFWNWWCRRGAARAGLDAEMCSKFIVKLLRYKRPSSPPPALAEGSEESLLPFLLLGTCRSLEQLNLFLCSYVPSCNKYCIIFRLFYSINFIIS